jgi:hypothetical protein
MSAPFREASWSDHDLAEHCVEREECAWQELDRRFHARLLSYCRWWLRWHGVADWNAAEDVTELVLAALGNRACARLRCYLEGGDPLYVCLRKQARRALSHWWQARGKRQGHEQVVDPHSLHETQDPHPSAPQVVEARAALLERARPALSPSERKLLEFQLNHPGEAPANYTRSTFASMMSRIKKKFPPG